MSLELTVSPGAGGGGGASEVLQATLTTVGAVNADFDAVAPWPEGRAATAIVYVVGTNATRTGVVGKCSINSYNRAIAGATFQAGAVSLYNANSGLAGTVLTLGISGNALRVRVTGIAGQTITWRITLVLYDYI